MSYFGIEARTVETIDVGYDSRVEIVNDEWVFRFPRRSQVEAWLETEIALLPELAPTLPVAVPRFEHVARGPVMCVGYRLIRGDPLSAEVAPDGVAAFLGALHAFDVDCAESLGVPRPDWRAQYDEQLAEFARFVFPLLDADERDEARAFFAAGLDLLGETESALVHADLLPEHMLCRDGELVGVIDWGDVRIGDPALDYAWLLQQPFGPQLDGERFRERALFYHRLAGWYEAHYGLLTEQADHVAAGLRLIRERR